MSEQKPIDEAVETLKTFLGQVADDMWTYFDLNKACTALDTVRAVQDTNEMLRGALSEIGVNAQCYLNAGAPDQESEDTMRNIRDIVDTALKPSGFSLYHDQMVAAQQRLAALQPTDACDATFGEDVEAALGVITFTADHLDTYGNIVLDNFADFLRTAAATLRRAKGGQG